MRGFSPTFSKECITTLILSAKRSIIICIAINLEYLQYQKHVTHKILNKSSLAIKKSQQGQANAFNRFCFYKWHISKTQASLISSFACHTSFRNRTETLIRYCHNILQNVGSIPLLPIGLLFFEIGAPFLKTDVILAYFEQFGHFSLPIHSSHFPLSIDCLVKTTTVYLKMFSRIGKTIKDLH